MHPGVHPGGYHGSGTRNEPFLLKNHFSRRFGPWGVRICRKKISKNLQNQRGDPSQIRRVPPLVFDQKKFFQFFFTEIFFFMVGTSGIDPLVIPENFSPLAQTVWKVPKIIQNRPKLAFHPPVTRDPQTITNSSHFRSFQYMFLLNFSILLWKSSGYFLRILFKDVLVRWKAMLRLFGKNGFVDLKGRGNSIILSDR